MKKLLLIVTATLAMTSLIAQKDAVKPYLSVEELPDLIKCLPAPLPSTVRNSPTT